MMAIYKREFKSYFHSMIGCIIVAFMIAFTGIYFMAYNLYSGYPFFSYVLMAINYVLIIVVPLLTMRSFAEERRNKTDQLLLCAPVRLSKVVLGKYLAMVSVFAIPCVVFCFYPLVIKSFGTAYLKVDYAAIFMFFLLGCVYIAIGMFLSSLTESQIIAAIATFGTLMIVYLWGGLLSFLPDIDFLVNILEKLDIVAVFESVVSEQMFQVSGLIYYLSLIGVFVFLTMQSIQKRRWS